MIKIDVRMVMLKQNIYRCVVLPVNVSAGHSRVLAQAKAVSLDRTRMVNITFSDHFFCS